MNNENLQAVGEQVNRRRFVMELGAGGLGAVGTTVLGGYHRSSCSDGPVLENDALRLIFDCRRDALGRISNRLTHKASLVRKDEFSIRAEEFQPSPENCRLETLQKKSRDRVEATYRVDGRTVVVAYTLGRNHHFFEKSLTIASDSSYRLKSLIVTKLSLAATPLRYVKYRHQKNCTYFAPSP